MENSGIRKRYLVPAADYVGPNHPLFVVALILSTWVLFLPSKISGQEVYKWKNEKGQWVISDQPDPKSLIRPLPPPSTEEREHVLPKGPEKERVAVQANRGITFEDVVRKFGVGGELTDLQKKDEWEKYRGKCAEGTGELAYVDEGWLGGIRLGFKHSPATLTYDVLVFAPRRARDMALKMEKGRRYEYRATLKDYGGAILPITADWGCH